MFTCLNFIEIFDLLNCTVLPYTALYYFSLYLYLTKFILLSFFICTVLQSVLLCRMHCVVFHFTSTLFYHSSTTLSHIVPHLSVLQSVPVRRMHCIIWYHLLLHLNFILLFLYSISFYYLNLFFIVPYCSPFLYVECTVGVPGNISASAAHRLAELARNEMMTR